MSTENQIKRTRNQNQMPIAGRLRSTQFYTKSRISSPLNQILDFHCFYPSKNHYFLSGFRIKHLIVAGVSKSEDTKHMKTKYSTWDWINVLVFPIAYIILMSGFFIFTSEIRLIKFFFTAGLLLTLLSIALSAIYFKNYIDNRTNKKGRFETNIWTLLGL